MSGVKLPEILSSTLVEVRKKLTDADLDFRNINHAINEYTFGIEVEASVNYSSTRDFLHIFRHQLSELGYLVSCTPSFSSLGLEDISIQHLDHPTVRFDLQTCRDSSLGDNSIEFVFPPSSLASSNCYKTIFLDCLKVIYYFVDLNILVLTNRCGLHVHVGTVTPENADNFQGILRYYPFLEKYINRFFVPHVNRSKYCKPCLRSASSINIPMLNAVRVFFEQPITKYSWGSIKNKFYKCFMRESSGTKYHSSRYHSANYHSLFFRNTLEFRIFNGLPDLDYIILAIKYVLFLCWYLNKFPLLPLSEIYKATVSEDDIPSFLDSQVLLSLDLFIMFVGEDSHSVESLTSFLTSSDPTKRDQVLSLSDYYSLYYLMDSSNINNIFNADTLSNTFFKSSRKGSIDFTDFRVWENIYSTTCGDKGLSNLVSICKSGIENTSNLCFESFGVALSSENSKVPVTLK